jgi:hypothetical protein
VTRRIPFFPFLPSFHLAAFSGSTLLPSFFPLSSHAFSCLLMPLLPIPRPIFSSYFKGKKNKKKKEEKKRKEERTKYDKKQLGRARVTNSYELIPMS